MSTTEVRICPKCGAENRRSNSACSNCYTSLAKVPLTQSGKGSTQQPGDNQTTRMSAQPEQTRSYSVPTQVQPGPPPPQYSIPPPKSNSTLKVILPVIIFVLAGLGIGAYLLMTTLHPKPLPPPKTAPDAVVLKFLEAKKTRKLEHVKPYLSKSSIYKLENSFSSEQARSAGFNKEEVAGMFLFDVTPTSRDLNNGIVKVLQIADQKEKEKNRAIVQVTVTPNKYPTTPQGAAPMPFEIPGLECECEFVLVIEGNRDETAWKVDIDKTAERSAMNDPMLKMLKEMK